MNEPTDVNSTTNENNSITFFENIAKDTNSLLCFGIDPVLERIPIKKGTTEDRIVNYFVSIVDKLIEDKVISAIKPNIAYFSQYGNEGLSALDKIISKYKGKLPIILDAKRGDIGKSSKAYATEIFDVWKADATTVSPYMGYDSIGPFLSYDKDGKIVYMLVKTSNSGSKDFQELYTNGMPLFKQVALKSKEWKTGMVVGATNPITELEQIVDAGIETPLLIPGIGAQGGSLKNVAYLINNSKINKYVHRVNVSSGIAYAYEKIYESADNAVQIAVKEAKKYKDMINDSLEKFNDVQAPTLSEQFTQFLIENNVLKFGDFTLKSGRHSPYFIKMDALSSGHQVFEMAEFYARKILKETPDVKAIYGPAYKGIPLAVAISTVLATEYNEKRNIIYCSDRKEEKKHGDKGKFLGGNISNKKVVIVDDVMTTGETKMVAIQKIKNNFENVNILGIFIAVDREEKWENDLASREFKKKTGVNVFSITKISNVFKYLHNRKINTKDGKSKVFVDNKIINAYEEYKSKYGVQ